MKVLTALPTCLTNLRCSLGYNPQHYEFNSPFSAALSRHLLGFYRLLLLTVGQSKRSGNCYKTELGFTETVIGAAVDGLVDIYMNTNTIFSLAQSFQLIT